MDEKVCAQCGKPNPSTTRFCGNCGWEFPGAPGSVTQPVPAPALRQPGRLSKKAMVLIALGVLVLLAVIVVLAISGGAGAQLPDYGVYLQQKTGLEALKAENFFNYPVVSEIKALTTASESPAAVVLRIRGGVTPAQVSLRSIGATRGEGKTLKITTSSGSSETLKVTPDAPLGNGVYCLFIGNPAAASIPGYCFQVGQPATAAPGATKAQAGPSATPAKLSVTATSTKVPQATLKKDYGLKIARLDQSGVLTIGDVNGKVLSTIAVDIKPALNWQMDWSPDSRYLVIYDNAAKTHIYLVDTQTRSIKKLPDQQWNVRNQLWSPSSDKFILDYDNIGSSNLLDLEGKSSLSIAGKFFWSPDGQFIYSNKNSSDLYAINVDTGKEEKINPGGKILTGYDMLKDGKLRLWYRDSDTVDVYDPSTRKLEPSIQLPQKTFFSLSPSGNYGLSKAQSSREVFLYNFKNKSQQKIWDQEGLVLPSIFWSPNEQGFYKVGNGEIFGFHIATSKVVHIDTSPSTALQRGIAIFPPADAIYELRYNAWLDDDILVLYGRNGLEFRHYLADARGNAIIDLCSGDMTKVICALWAP